MAKNRPSRNASLATLDFGVILLGIHSALGALTSCPEFELEKREADKFAKALKDAIKYRPAGLSAEKMAWINVGLVGTELYAPRIMAWRLRRAEEKKAALRRAPAAVPPTPIDKVKAAAPPAGPPPGAAGTGTYGVMPDPIWNQANPPDEL
jgi:hypothetical protein